MGLHPSEWCCSKGHGPDGFAFYTNLDSRKGAEIAANPHAALLFHWKSLRRQVRVEGPLEAVSDPEADAYFADPLAEFSAWRLGFVPVAPAGQHERRSKSASKMCSGALTRTECRGRLAGAGFRVRPERIEFWDDRPHRLHERRVFSATADGWTEGLLYP